MRRTPDSFKVDDLYSQCGAFWTHLTLEWGIVSDARRLSQVKIAAVEVLVALTRALVLAFNNA